MRLRHRACWWFRRNREQLDRKRAGPLSCRNQYTKRPETPSLQSSGDGNLDRVLWKRLSTDERLETHESVYPWWSRPCTTFCRDSSALTMQFGKVYALT